MAARAMNQSNDRHPLASTSVKRRFDAAAAGFDNAAFVHTVARDGLLQRVAPMLIKPKQIVDLGCATGAGARALAKQYRGSQVLAVDSSAAMLRESRRLRSRFSKVRELLADAETLPLQKEGTDLVFSNLLLPWLNEPEAAFSRIAHILRPGGLFLFSALGQDSLKELREAWAEVDGYQHVNSFPDMHNIGDALVRAGLRDPVLDVDYLTVTYREPRALYKDLTEAGARNSLTRRNPALTGRQLFHRMERALEKRFQNGQLSLTIEIVYGHAWGGGAPQLAGEFRVPASGIGHRQTS